MTATYRTLLALVLCSAGVSAGCGDGDDPPPKFTRDASSAERTDAGPEDEEEEPSIPVVDSGRRDAAADLDADLNDAGEDLDAEQTDAEQTDAEQTDAEQTDAEQTDAEQTDAADVDADAADADTPDADLDANVDASTDVDAGADATMADDAAQPDATTGDHALAGHYAARTVIYLRQEVDFGGGEPLELVSKAELLSTVDIDAQGGLRERYCFLEIVPADGIASWMKPAAAQLIPESVTTLTQQASGYARAADGTHVSWSPANQPADCTPGATHSSGCRCYAPASIPRAPDDCRVRDLDGDGTPGSALVIGAARPLDPAVETGLVTLHITATKSIGWQLPGAAGERLVGQIEGGLEQAELSRSGEFAEEFGAISNSVCPASSGHVELVRGNYDCAAILALRAADLENAEEADDALSEGLFNAQLDGTTPDIAACPEPSCGADGDGDGTLDCQDGCAADPAKTEAGVCGCGRPDTNTDGDAAPDCSDGCPNDAAKLAAGACGCGVAETDTDGDSTPDCTDACDNDPLKTAAGACGCGVADTNSDSDSAPDCSDECAGDPNKTAPGTCGCGTADTDSDGDGLANCNDACVDDPNKTTTGLCGCGVAETNGDGDAQPDCTDECDGDPAKVTAGACGCGVSEANADGDAAPDCTDECDGDPAKIAAGACGCGNPDTNADGDAAPDCTDECDSDPNKVTAGACGCGTPDTNSDSDAQPDCRDECDTDSNKTVPGVCGCGVPDQDLNGDTTIDCRDDCPADPAKVAPGACGCGVPDTNSDGDARLDCQEDCDQDAAKTAPGQCGCGVADTDTDRDGVADCNDACDNDPNKTTLGLCGCGVAETNTDGDAAPNCTDECDNDPNKVVAGACGCGVADTNTDGDAAPNCTDECDNDPNKVAAGACGCGVPETNTDGDAAPDCNDECDNDPTRTTAGPCGCSDCAPNPIAGSYAVRTAVFGKQRNGDTVFTTKSLGYSLITISEGSDRSLQLSERGCYTHTVPRLEDPGTKAYSWSKPAWVQALPLSEQTLVANANGSYTRTIPSTPIGWNPARQPSSCSASSTPLAPWSWGTTCQCNAPASALPPYDRNTAPYDCRLVDADGDGQPGMSAIGASVSGTTVEPSSPSANPPALGATAFAAVTARGTWLITPASDGRHTATVDDTSEAQVVGCSGIACAGLSASPPASRNCPAALNRVQFVPVTSSSDTCDEIIASRNTLFVQNQDAAWPDGSACPAP